MIGVDVLIRLIVLLVVVGLIAWVAFWALREIAPPEPFNKVARVLLVLFVALFIISLLLSLVGYPLVRF